MVPLGEVHLAFNEVSDELSTDRKEDETISVETTVYICTQTDSVGNIIWRVDAWAEVVYVHVVVQEPCSLVPGYQMRVFARASCNCHQIRMLLTL